MKKFFLLLLSLVMFLLAIGCNSQESVNDVTKKDEKEEAPVSQMVSTVELNTIDDLVKYSHTIVYGTVVDVDPFSEGTNEYLFKVHEAYKMKLDTEDIYIYEADGALNVGESYLLFLSAFTGGFFPHPTYTSINKDAILKVDDDYISHNSPYLPEYKTLDKIVQDISNSPSLSHQIQIENDLVLLSNTSLREVTDNADIIAEVIPTKYTTENKYMKVAEVKVTKSHKGHLDSGSIVHFPASIELEKEYLVYLRNEDGALIVNSVDNGVIETGEHKKLDEALQILDN